VLCIAPTPLLFNQLAGSRNCYAFMFLICVLQPITTFISGESADSTWHDLVLHNKQYGVNRNILNLKYIKIENNFLLIIFLFVFLYYFRYNKPDQTNSNLFDVLLL